MTLNEFRESEFGRQCAEWLLSELKDNGPLRLSAIGNARLTPRGVSLLDWLSSLPEVICSSPKPGKEFCVAVACSPDGRRVRTRLMSSPPKHAKDVLHPLSSVPAEGNGPAGPAPVGMQVISREVWNRYLRQLEKDSSWTVWFSFSDGSEPLTASSFLSGDEEAMMVQVRDRGLMVERRVVARIELVKKANDPERGPGIGTTGTGIVSAWYRKSFGGFGFVVAGSQTFYFGSSGISVGHFRPPES